MTQKRFIAIVLLAGMLILPSAPVFAACSTAAECAASGINSADGGTASNTSVGSIIQNIVNILMFLVGAVAVVMLVIGGLRYVTSQGDSSSVQAAKSTIQYSVIGLIVAILGYAIVNFFVGVFSGGTSPSVATNDSSSDSSSDSTSDTDEATGEDTSDAEAVDDGATTADPAPSDTPTPSPPSNSTPVVTGKYRNGTYTATISYNPKGHPDTLTTKLTVSSDVVTAVTVTDNPSNSTSKSYVNDFKAALSSAVVGKPLSGLAPSRIGGASLTTNAFNKTLTDIRTQAAA